MILRCSASTPAPDFQIAAEVTSVLERRAAMASPPVDLTVSDAVARGIAALFVSRTASGRVLDAFFRTGTADSNELIEAARFEQGYATAEGHAALHCLIGWARGRLHRSAAHASPA